MDTPRLDLSQPGALEDAARQLGVPPERLRAAIEAVGPELDKLKGWLASPAALAPRPPGSGG